MHQRIDAVPTARSTSATERELPPVYTELHQQRRFRLEQLDEFAADAAEAMATADEPRLQVIRVLRIAAEAALGEIDAARRRLEDGVYGTCERCEEPIPWERLEVLPMARLCIPCQGLTESRRFRPAKVSLGR